MNKLKLRLNCKTEHNYVHSDRVHLGFTALHWSGLPLFASLRRQSSQSVRPPPPPPPPPPPIPTCFFPLGQLLLLLPVTDIHTATDTSAHGEEKKTNAVLAGHKYQNHWSEHSRFSKDFSLIYICQMMILISVTPNCDPKLKLSSQSLL